MTVKELCLKLCDLREKGKIKDDTLVYFICFDTEEYINYYRLSLAEAKELGYELNGEKFLELVTELKIEDNAICLS